MTTSDARKRLAENAQPTAGRVADLEADVHGRCVPIGDYENALERENVARADCDRIIAGVRAVPHEDYCCSTGCTGPGMCASGAPFGKCDEFCNCSCAPFRALLPDDEGDAS